jgi:hypothetical protein
MRGLTIGITGFRLISSNRREPIFRLSHRRSMLTPAQLRSIARIAARIGQSDRSISTLQKLLSIPYEAPLAAKEVYPPWRAAHSALLRLDLMFDSLRKDPRFQKLVASSAPK